MNRKFFIILFLILSTVSTIAQNIYSDMQNILEMQQRRVLSHNGKKLLDYLEEDDDNVVLASIIAIANIGDTGNTVIDGIAERMDDPEKIVRYTAAFALGSLPSQRSERIMLSELGKQTDRDILAMLIKGLSKFGSAAALDKIVNIKNLTAGQHFIDELELEFPLAVARYGMRKIISNAAFEKLMSLQFNDNTFYALSRIGDEESLQQFKDRLVLGLNDSSPERRMWTASAIGRSKNNSLVRLLIDKYRDETDWRVKVNIINALGNLDLINADDNSETLNFILSRLNEANEHMVLSAINAIGKAYKDIDIENDLAGRIKEKLINTSRNENVSPAIRSNSVMVLSQLYKDKVENDLFKLFSIERNFEVKSSIINSFGFFTNPLIYKNVRDTLSAEIKRYNEINSNLTGNLIGSEDLAKMYRGFLSMLRSLNANMDDENKNTVRLIYLEFMNSGDPVISSLAADGLLDPMYESYRNEIKQVLLFDYPSLKTSEMKQIYTYAFGELKIIEAVNILEDNLNSDDYLLARESGIALNKINGKDYSKKIEKAFKPNIDWKSFTDLQKKNAAIVTNKGTIRIELFPEFAPFTVLNFIQLAQKNFYNGILFHRVVPNFVIQAGDPTGTGYSGPGYSIRTEIAPASFNTGFLGMASSGKDTEGSQFFITHSPQFHLDGKYTLFGKVIEGMDVVNNIYQGDKIEYITID